MSTLDYKAIKTSSSSDRQVSSLSKNNTLANTSSQASKGESLVKGQIIKAQVIDLRGRDVKIQLSNSEIITGKINSDVPLSIGDQATFQVEEASPTSISLKVMADNRMLSQDILIDKALEDARIPKSDRSISIVRELLNNQLSIDKGSIQKLLQQAATFRNASIQTLVLMNKYNIELNDVNTTQFEAYRNYEHRLINGSATLIDSVLSNMHGIETDVAKQLHIMLLTLSSRTSLDEHASFNDSTNQSLIANDPVNSAVTVLGENISGDIGLVDGSNITTGTGLVDGSNIITGTGILDVSIIASSTGLIDTSDITSSTGMIDGSNITTGAEMNAGQLGVTTDSRKISDIIVANDYNHSQNDLNASNSIGYVLSSELREELYGILPSEMQTEEIKAGLLDGTYSTKDILKGLEQQISTMDASALQKLQDSSPYQTLIKDTLMRQWSFTPKMLKNSTLINIFYEQLENDFHQLESFLHTVTGENLEHSFDQAGNQSHQLHDNIDFMRTLNQLFTYVQLPMKLSEQNAHCELFVYTNKKALKKNQNSISVLLHLDMKHLGPLDIHLDLNNRNVLSKFYTAEQSKSLLEKHLPILSERLEENGYSLAYEIYKREREIDLVKDFIQKEEPSSGLKRYTFDIRA